MYDDDKPDGTYSAPKKCSVYVQTDYRDGVTQTQPFSTGVGECLDPPPEIMTIATMVWGKFQ